MKTYDAIVIGAGHNGLVNACYLAKAGLDVIVLERNDYIGGAAVSRELHPGWKYSNCSYVCSLLRPEIIRDLELPRFGLQVVPYEGSLSFMRNGDYLASYADHDSSRREIARHSPRDAEAYERYQRDVMRQCRFIKPLLMRAPPDPTSFKPRDVRELLYLGKKFWDLGEAQMYDTIRFWTMSIAEYLDEYFESDIVKATLAGSGIIGTALGPYSPGSAYVLLHHYMGEQILVENDDTVGVALEDGEEVRGRIVISNLDVKRTFLNCMDPKDLPGDFLDAVKRFKIRGSSGKLNIALDGLPTFRGVPEGSPALTGEKHFSDTMERIERAYDDWKAGTWSKDPYVDMLIPTQIDPSMAPPGKHYMSVFVQYAPPNLADGQVWDGSNRDAFAKTVIDQIAEYSPDFEDLIVHIEARTPQDIENEVGLTEGNIFQGELTFDQLLFNRPVPGYAQYRGPVDGLYMCGSSTHPGGGVMGAPGANAAREVLRDLKIKGEAGRAGARW
jgi:phytoene dehydrogenase-like protein